MNEETKGIVAYSSFTHQYYFLWDLSTNEKLTELQQQLIASGRHRIEKRLRKDDAYNRGKEPDVLDGHEDKKKRVVLQLTVCCSKKMPRLSSGRSRLY